MQKQEWYAVVYAKTPPQIAEYAKASRRYRAILAHLYRKGKHPDVAICKLIGGIAHNFITRKPWDS